MIFHEQANHYGTLAGGRVLVMMAWAAFVAALRHARMAAVMARSDRVDFATPVRVGELVEKMSARVTRTGRSSMTVAVEGHASAIDGAAARRALQGTFEMVAVDAQGQLRAIVTGQQKRQA